MLDFSECVIVILGPTTVIFKWGPSQVTFSSFIYPSFRKELMSSLKELKCERFNSGPVCVAALPACARSVVRYELRAQLGATEQHLVVEAFSAPLVVGKRLLLRNANVRYQKLGYMCGICHGPKLRLLRESRDGQVRGVVPSPPSPTMSTIRNFGASHPLRASQQPPAPTRETRSQIAARTEEARDPSCRQRCDLFSRPGCWQGSDTAV